MHSWPLPRACGTSQRARRKAWRAAQLRRRRRALLAQFAARPRRAGAQARPDGPAHLRRRRADPARPCGVHRMNLMGNPRRMPSMVGYGLEVTGYLADGQHLPPDACFIARRIFSGTPYAARRGKRQAGSTASDWIGIVQARFNDELTDAAREACTAELIARRAPKRHRPRDGARRARDVCRLQALADATTTTRWSRWAASSAARPTTSSWWPTRAAPA
jgi:hypothetical protein